MSWQALESALDKLKTGPPEILVKVASTGL